MGTCMKCGPFCLNTDLGEGFNGVPGCHNGILHNLVHHSCHTVVKILINVFHSSWSGESLGFTHVHRMVKSVSVACRICSINYMFASLSSEQLVKKRRRVIASVHA